MICNAFQEIYLLSINLKGKLCQHELLGHDLLSVRFWPFRELMRAAKPSSAPGYEREDNLIIMIDTNRLILP